MHVPSSICIPFLEHLDLAAFRLLCVHHTAPHQMLCITFIDFCMLYVWTAQFKSSYFFFSGPIHGAHAPVVVQSTDCLLSCQQKTKIVTYTLSLACTHEPPYVTFFFPFTRPRGFISLVTQEGAPTFCFGLGLGLGKNEFVYLMHAKKFTSLAVNTLGRTVSRSHRGASGPATAPGTAALTRPPHPAFHSLPAPCAPRPPACTVTSVREASSQCI